MNRIAAAILAAALARAALGQEKLHFTYLWHLEQPIYWPERRASGDRYERAWESIQRQDAGGAHPQDNLRDIFGLADRQAVYQFRVRDCLSAISGAPEAGAQVTYSGGLIENIASLGAAGQLGYGPGWADAFRQARGWPTNAPGVNKPRLDVVLFSFHHALLPLLDDAAVRKEVQLYKQVYAGAWGSGAPMSGGFFPSEMAFSARLVPILAAEGVRWTFVSGEKLSRACPDFPVVLGSGGVNCDPPNRADQRNPPAGAYYRQSISRGCSPAEAVPFAFTPHRVRVTDPSTGAVSELIVVPCSQSLGWRDGYAPLGLGDFNALDATARPARPMLAVLAHDGDNAWGGGFSYYLEATPNLVSQARAAGYVPTVVEKYLADHPVPADDLVHVEQGAWVNADGDFGSPAFLNWNWPLLDAAGGVDIDQGWHEDARNWAVITAAVNRVVTAEQIAGGARPEKILDPDASTTNAERAWHYLLAGLNSGFMYYGTSLDMEIKPSVACNRALSHADQVIGNGALDQTPPTVWEPQRFPWNPGSTNFGPQFGYRAVENNGDFKVYTFAADVSGVASVVLKYRLDLDGQRGLTSPDNDTYAGGPGVGAWQTLPMTRRAFPAGNVYNNPGIDFSTMPAAIAEQFTASVQGIRGRLVDYYVEAVDARGAVARTAIQHVWVGDGSGAGGGGGPAVTLEPASPVAGQNVTITYDPAGRSLAGAPQVRLHYGFNSWTTVVSPDPAMTATGAVWRATVALPAGAAQLDMVFNNGAGVWDNNGGQDWHFAVTPGGGSPGWTMDGARDVDSVLVASNGGMHLWAGLKGDELYVATEDAGEGNDHFILLARAPGAPRAAMWAKAGVAAGWDAFLADENSNDYEGWFDAGAGVTTRAATGANGGVLEGTFDLRERYGMIPEVLFLAVAPYANPDGGGLLSTHQVPASVNGDGAVDPAEHLAVRLCEVAVNSDGSTGGCCPADFNRDGFLDFFDYDEFVGCFESGACPPGAGPDFNRDGFADFFDYDAFVAAYEAGC